jgi:hypothetical protein
MASLMYNTLFETPYNEELMRRVRKNALRKQYYNPTEPEHISYAVYPSVNGSGRQSDIMSGGAIGYGRGGAIGYGRCGGIRGDPRSLGFDYDPRYLRSGSTINFPAYNFDDMMRISSAGGVRNTGFHYQDDFNPYYNRVVSANFGTARPSFSRGMEYEEGGSKVGNFFKKVGHFLAPVGRAVTPVLKDVGKELLVEGIKGAITGAGKRRGRPRKVVGVGRFEGSGHPSGMPIPNDMYSGSGNLENVVINKVINSKKFKKMTGGVALYKPNGKIYRGATHEYDGVIHTGKNHTKSSVPLAEMTAGNAKTFFRKVGNTFKSIGHAVAPIAVPVLKEVGKDLLKGAIMGAVVGAGKKRGRPKGSGGKRKNVNKEGEPKMCCFPAGECGAKPTRAGRPKGAKNKLKGGQGASVDSAGILGVTPNPPPELQVVGASGGKSNIGRKIKNTFKKVGKFLAPAVPVLKSIGQEVYKEVKPILVEEGKKALKEGIKGAISGSGTKKGQVRKTARKAYEGLKKPNARAEIVRKIMKERGVKMIEASKIVKAEGLY